MMKRSAVALLATMVALLGGCASTEGEVAAPSATSEGEGPDLAACERVLREAFDQGTADMEGGTQPPECAGASDQQIEDLFTEIVGDAFAESAESTPEPEPTPTEPEYGEFGGAGFTWDDGIQVEVSKLKEFTPSEYAAFDESPAYVRMTLTVTNGSDAPFDASLVTLSAQSGGREFGEVYDSEAGLNGPPTTPVLPGRSVKFDAGFGVADPVDVVLQVTPSFDHDPALFVTQQ
jgi:hypothetical protein